MLKQPLFMWNYMRFNFEYVPYALIQQNARKNHNMFQNRIPYRVSDPLNPDQDFPWRWQNPDPAMFEDADPGFLRQNFEK
jgi:hypothetical protein